MKTFLTANRSFVTYINIICYNLMGDQRNFPYKGTHHHNGPHWNLWYRPLLKSSLLALPPIIEHSSFGELFSFLLALIYLHFIYDRQMKFFSNADFLKTCDSKPRNNGKVGFSGRFTFALKTWRNDITHFFWFQNTNMDVLTLKYNFN